MKLNYKQPDTSVNVSKVSPLKRAFQLIMGLAVTFVGIYVLLGLLVNIIAPYVPEGVEHKMGEIILADWPVEKEGDTVDSYREILVKLVGETEAEKYTICIDDESDLNAYAIPGNVIAFTTGFVENVEDEEMIAFAMGHELGHFENRDHIKGYGRVVVLYTMVSTLAGSDGTLADLIGDVLNKTEMKFSQNDELKADAYGAGLVKNTYGSHDGGIAFFELINEEYDSSQLVAYFDSHPHPEKRIEALQELMEE